MKIRPRIFDAGDRLSETKDGHLRAFNDALNRGFSGLGSRLGLAPGESVALEHSRTGLRSARRERLPCIVASGAYTNDTTVDEADAVVSCFSDIATLVDPSPIMTTGG